MTDEKGKIRQWLEDTFDLSWKDELELWLAWGVLRRKAPKMGEILKRFWSDPAYATAAIRTVIGVLANLILSGQIPLPGGRLGVVIWSVATMWPAILAVPAGQTNQSAGDIKAISIDPKIAPTPPKP